MKKHATLFALKFTIIESAKLRQNYINKLEIEGIMGIGNKREILQPFDTMLKILDQFTDEQYQELLSKLPPPMY